MTGLSKEERAALVEALENDGNVTGCTGRLRELGFAKNRLGLRFILTHVGEIVAELIKENDEWKELVSVERLAREKADRRCHQLEESAVSVGTWRWVPIDDCELKPGQYVVRGRSFCHISDLPIVAEVGTYEGCGEWRTTVEQRAEEVLFHGSEPVRVPEGE